MYNISISRCKQLKVVGKSLQIRHFQPLRIQPNKINYGINCNHLISKRLHSANPNIDTHPRKPAWKSLLVIAVLCGGSIYFFQNKDEILKQYPFLVTFCCMYVHAA